MLTTFCPLIWIMTQSKCQLFNVCDKVQKQIFAKKSCWSNECHTIYISSIMDSNDIHATNIFYLLVHVAH